VPVLADVVIYLGAASVEFNSVCNKEELPEEWEGVDRYTY